MDGSFRPGGEAYPGSDEHEDRGDERKGKLHAWAEARGSMHISVRDVLAIVEAGRFSLDQVPEHGFRHAVVNGAPIVVEPHA